MQGMACALAFKHKEILDAPLVDLKEYRHRGDRLFWKKSYTWVPEGSYLLGMNWERQCIISSSTVNLRGALPLKGPPAGTGRSNGGGSRKTLFLWIEVGWHNFQDFIDCRTSRYVLHLPNFVWETVCATSSMFFTWNPASSEWFSF
jgi:hypothetical protein